MSKGRIINIEWTPDNNFEFDRNVFSKNKLRWITKELEKAAQDGCDTVITLHLIDGLLSPEPDFFPKEVTAIKQKCNELGIKQCIFVSGHGETYPLPLDFDQIHFFDYTLRFTYNAFKQQIDNDSLPRYSPDTSKFLFLGGVPSRPNRIGLAYKYYKLGLLTDENAVWTFFPPWCGSELRDCRKILPDVPEEEYQAFLKHADRKVDNIYDDAKIYFADEGITDEIWHDVTDTEWVHKPAYIDSSIYEKTCVSIISEGPNYWDYNPNNYFVTEKFWRAVFHRHPFIFSGEIDQFRYMQNKGFKSFENYMLDKDYAFHNDESARIDGVVKNTEHFIKNHRLYANEIVQDVDHNFNLAMEHIKKQEEFMIFLTEHYGVPQEEVRYFFDQAGYFQVIRRPPEYD